MHDQLDRHRIIDKKDLRRLVPYTPHHISRLEKAGTFPPRIRLGGNRVGWILGEILDWIEQRKIERDTRLRDSKSVEAGVEV